MRLAWGAKVSPLFRERLLGICARLGIDDPGWLMACIAFETGHTFSSRVQNAQSNATGLIQFMPSTARGLGTTVETLKELSPEDQLEWVERYFQPYAGRLHSLDDVYMAILWPKAIGKLLNWPLFSKDDADSRAYFGNRGLDVNADGVVTKGEATAYVQKSLNAGLEAGNWLELDWESGVGAPISPAPIPTPKTPNFTPLQRPESMMLPAFLLQLLPMILGGFSPSGQAQLQPMTSKPIDQLAPFLLDLFGKIAQTTGVVPPGQPVVNNDQAIAAVAEFNKLKATNTALIAEIESHALDYLDKIAPFVKQIHAMEMERKEQSIKGQDAAAKRSLLDRWDMTKALVLSSEGLAWAIVLGGFSGVGAAIWVKEYNLALAILGIVGTITGNVLKNRSQAYDYRFDGTESSQALNLSTQAIAKALPK